MDEALADKTATTYQRYYNKFSEFCEKLKLRPKGKGSAHSVELWVAELSKCGLTYGTVQSHLSAVRHVSKREGLDIDIQSDKIQLALKGLKRKTIHAPKKHAVSLSELALLQSKADVLPAHTSLMFRIMVSLAFFGFLRPSEYCITTEDHHLKFGDIKLAKSGKSCYLRLKSYKHSVKPTIIKIMGSWSKSDNVVSLLRTYLDRNSHQCKTAPLFNISVARFRSMLCRVAAEAGLKSLVTPHCFRHGGATWASKQGWSTARIQAHGRWRSSAYTSYVNSY